MITEAAPIRVTVTGVGGVWAAVPRIVRRIAASQLRAYLVDVVRIEAQARAGELPAHRSGQRILRVVPADVDLLVRHIGIT